MDNYPPEYQILLGAIQGEWEKLTDKPFLKIRQHQGILLFNENPHLYGVHIHFHPNTYLYLFLGEHKMRNGFRVTIEDSDSYFVFYEARKVDPKKIAKKLLKIANAN